MPKFRIEGVATIRGRSMFFCHGDVVSGSVAVGQRVVTPVGLPPVAAIELVLFSQPTRHEKPALGFQFENEDHLARLQHLLPIGTDVVVAEDGGVAV